MKRVCSYFHQEEKPMSDGSIFILIKNNTSKVDKIPLNMVEVYSLWKGEREEK